MAGNEAANVRPPTAEEERLAAWFEEQELHSLDRLEAAARQMVGLVTGLMGFLVAVVSLTSYPYTVWYDLRYFILVDILFFLAALVAGLLVLWPRRWRVSSRNLTQQRCTFEAILRYKSWSLRIALAAFFLGVAMLAFVFTQMVVTRR